MHEPLDLSTIVFALVAIFVVWKLRSVLGTRTGSERPPANPFARRTPAPTGTSPRGQPGNVIPLPGAAAQASTADPDRYRDLAAPGSKAAAGLDAIAGADPTFDAAGFVNGAKAAYDLIVGAFARGDRAALRPLLARDVLDGFVSAIDAREARGERVESTVVSIDKATADDAQVRGGTAQVSMRFLSKQITVTRDRAGAVVDGSPDTVVDMVDIWTFSRDIASRDPNWKLAATESGH